MIWYLGGEFCMCIIREQEIRCNNFKLVFSYIEEFNGYGYSLWVENGDKWEQISDTKNPLVRGKSFDLYPQKIEMGLNNNEMIVSGIKKNVHTSQGIGKYTWSGKITADSTTGWLNINLELMCEDDILLQMTDGFEPEITVNMGNLPPYERGDHVWFKTSITGPTKWNDDAHGNDIPALYYYDPYRKYQMMMFFNMTAMTWMSRKNIARFLNYRCRHRRVYGEADIMQVGLMADGFSGKVFPKGKQTIEYCIKANAVHSPITEQDAVSVLVDECLKLLPARQEWHPDATSWKEFSDGCANELLDENSCWSKVNGIEFLMAYYDAVSPAWHEAMEARNARISFYEAFDFCVTVWVLYPLLLLERNDKNAAYSALSSKLMGTVKDLINNWDKHKLYTSESMGTWQYTSMLHDLFKVGEISNFTPAIDRVIKEVEEILLPFSERVSYLFPLSFNTITLKKAGNGENYAIAGMFAHLMLLLYDYTGEDKYLNSAKSAINVLYNLPVNSILQESFLIPYGVQASLRLYSIYKDEKYLSIAKYLLSQNLRLAYWYNDKTKDTFNHYNLLGMFQACTPMLYPAFLENSMCLSMLSAIFRYMHPQKGILRLFNLGRINNFYMFPKCLPEEFHITKSLYVPYENLGTLEDDKMGYVGQEIYGSGGVFWFYMLWEAFASSDNKDIMVMNLDLFENNKRDLCESDLMFIAYNPMDKEIRSKVHFNFLKQNSYVLIGPDLDNITKEIALEGGEIDITIKPDDCVYIKLFRG